MNNYNNYRSGGGRSRRRKRQKMIKTVVLTFVILIIITGFALSLFLLGRMGNNPDVKETDTAAKETDFLPDETEPEDTASGILAEGYTTEAFTEADLHKGDLILVSAGAPYVFPEENDLKDIYSGRKKYDNGARAYQVSGVDLLLDKEVLSKLNEMNEAFYEETGENALLIKSSYRSYEDQKALYDFRVERDGEEEAKKYVANPGESEHHTGMAFDMSVYKDGVNTYIQDEEAYLPIYENAHRYGFILRYPENKVDITGIAYEAWHFRYVGIPHAYYMHAEGLVLEEYLELLKNSHPYNGTHLKIDFEGSQYEIYYVPAILDAEGKGTTEIILPSGYEYSVSGNNTDGFIVTVLTGGGDR